MRMRAKVDANQREIVEALRTVGCSVQSLAAIGKGCPDILIGIHGMNFLAEIKDGKKRPSARKPTEDEERWAQLWRGTVYLLTSTDEAIELVSCRLTSRATGAESPSPSQDRPGFRRTGPSRGTS